MKKKYLYNGQLMELADIEYAAKQSNIDVNSYIQKAGIKEIDDSYTFQGKTFSASDILDAAKQSNLGFDDYIQKAGFQSGEKKNQTSNGTPTESKPTSTKSEATTSPSGSQDGLIEKGNIDLAKQPNVYNPYTKGQSTVWSMSIGTDKGETLISRVTPDGKVMTEKEAVGYYKKTGKHLGIFKTVDEANSYAEQLHEDYESGKIASLQPPLPVNTNVISDFDLPFTKTPVVVTNDGTQFPVTHLVSNNLVSTQNTPAAIQDLQLRIASNTVTDEDVKALAKSSGKTVAATDAYLRKGKDEGSALDVNDNLIQKKQEIVTGFNALGKSLGFIWGQFNADDILASADKSALFLQQINNLQNDDAKRKAKIQVPSAMSFAPPSAADEKFAPSIDPALADQVNNTKEALYYNIKKLTADEVDKKGLSDEQASDLLYKRLDPTGYAKNQAMRNTKPTGVTDRTFTSVLKDVVPIAGAVDAINTFSDWVTKTKKLNKETLNAERSQYELDANEGLKYLAIEKKSQGVINNDETLLAEAATLGDKIKDDNAIVEKYPLLMKQTMADYINKRYADEAGILEGTEPKGLNGRLLNVAGINSDVARRYLKEGGFYDKPNYKDFAEEVATHQNTYLADNSVFGGVGMSFLKPFKSIFNSAADLIGARTEEDRHLENVRDELFPKALSQGVKEDIAFDIGKAHLGMSVANTVNSVANLGGYIAITAATGGIAGQLGASATTAERMGAWASFGMDAIDTGLKEADKMGLTPAESWLYAGMKGAMMAEGGRLLEFGKVHVPTIKGVNEGLAKAAVGITNKTLSENGAKELLNGAGSAWLKGLTKWGIGTAKGAGVMTGFSIGDNLIKLGFGDKNVNPDEMLPEAANAYFNGLFTMGVIGSMGIRANIESAKNSTYKGMLSKIIDNHDASQDVLKIGLEKGLYTKDEYNEKVQILNVGMKAKATLNDVIAKEGIKLTPEQKSAWVANTTVEKILRNEAAKDGITEAKSKDYTQQADNLVEQNTKILNGLQFNHLLEPQTKLHDADLELKKAQAEFAEKPTPENEQTVLDKKAAFENIQLKKPSEDIRENFNEAQPFIITPEARKDVGDIVQKINNAEYINEGELNKAADHLYDLLDKHGDNQSFANLIEPLINKIESYDFRTKTEVSTVTEKVPVEVAKPVVERKAVNKSISQWEGNRATTTDATGKTTEGIISLENGKYYLKNENGDKISVLGESAITDRDVTLPSPEEVPIPIKFDKNGDVESITLQLNKVDKEHGGTVRDKLITINLKDKEKALDYAIQLQAEQVGDYPQQKFDIAYKEVQRQIQEEVPVKDLTIKSEPKKETATETKPVSNEKAEPIVAAEPKSEPTVKTEEVKPTKNEKAKVTTDTKQAAETGKAAEGTTETGKQAETPTKKDLATQARELAADLESGKKNVLPEWMRAKLPPGTKYSGIDINQAFANALKTFADIHDATKDFKKAVDEGFKHIKEWFNENNVTFDEAEMKANFAKDLGGKLAEDEGDKTGISHAETDRVRKQYKLGAYERDNATNAELEAIADEAIKKGYNPETLIRQMESGIPPSGAENYILKKYLATLEAKFDKSQTDANLEPIERLVKATDKIGSLQSEAFRTRKGIVPVDDSLAGFFITEKEVNLDAPLTEKQKETVKKEYEDISEAQKKYDEKIAALEKENAKLRADAEVKKTASVKKPTTEKRTHEDFVKERRDILDRIKEKWKNAGKGTLSSDIPYRQQFAAIAPDVAKLVKSLVEEGVTKLSDVVAHIHDSLKDSIDEITKDDIHNIIAGEYNEKKKTKNEISAQIFGLKQEAKLINRLEKLESGIEPKGEKEKIKRNQEIESLKKQIKEHDLTKLASYKAKTKTQIEKLEQDLANGNYENVKTAIPIKLDKEATILKDKLIKVKNERQLRIIKQQQENMSGREKAMKGVAEVLNIPRTLMTIVDYSAVLRQGLIQTISHPQLVLNAKIVDGRVKIGGAAVDMIKAGVSQKVYDRWYFDLKETPRYDLIEKSGLGVTDSSNPLLTVHEESFMSNLAEKIPIIGKTLNLGGGVKIPGTNLVKGSERSYTLFINKLRVDVFNRFADAMEERGLTFENSPKQFKQMAEYVNNSTGRGSLGAGLNKIAPILNALLFSPRLIAARLNMLTYLAQPKFYKEVPKEVRKAYFKDMAKFIGVGITVLALASLSDDNTVEVDPRSSDFGKIKNKNTRWDIWGGFQPFIRVATQALMGERKTVKGKIQDIGGDKPAFGTTKGQVLLDFTRTKLAPVPAMAVDLFSGRTLVGDKIEYDFGGKEKKKEITIDRYLKDHLLPLTYTGLEDALKDQGVKALFTVGIPSVFGIGTQTYSSTKSKK